MAHVTIHIKGQGQGATFSRCAQGKRYLCNGVRICVGPEAAVYHHQVMASMGEVLTRINQVKADLATSIRQAATWSGHSRAQSATPAQQQQVCPLCSEQCKRADWLFIVALFPGTTRELWRATSVCRSAENLHHDTCWLEKVLMLEVKEWHQVAQKSETTQQIACSSFLSLLMQSKGHGIDQQIAHVQLC